jgi:hypothetical protein
MVVLFVSLFTQVEWVLMRAMSIGLLKGTIDEVGAAVNVTWVQPRVLDKEQLALLNTQLKTWTEKYDFFQCFIFIFTDITMQMVLSI